MEGRVELPAERLAVGKIKASHGLKGYLKVRSLSGETGHFFRLRRVYVVDGDRAVAFEVEHVIDRGVDLLLKLAGLENRESADRFRGREIWVERRDASTLNDGQYYLADLCRCRVYRGGTEIGRVLSVCEGSRQDYLEVEASWGETLIVPFSDHFVGRVDVENRSIELSEGYQLP